MKTVIAFFLLSLALAGAYQIWSVDNVTFTVTGKERVVSGSGDNMSSYYLIFTENETFENSDALFHGKFNSSDIYGKLREGFYCSARVYGFRVPFLSMYRNIISVSCNE